MRPMRYVLLASLLGLGAAFLLAGCPPKPPTPSPPAPRMDLSLYPSCPVDMVPPAAGDVCDGLFTAEGLACVACVGPGTSGCLYPKYNIYCANGPCAADLRCDWRAGAKLRR